MDIDKIPNDFITHAIVNMKASKQHTFLILTKRAKHMAEYVTKYWPEGVPNIFWGATVENQQRLNERLPYILQIPGKIWLSLEPLLSRINTNNYLQKCECGYFKTEHGEPDVLCKKFKSVISQIIVGCETGKNARPCKIEWLESIVDQCKEAGVPCFVKAINLNGKITSDITKFPKPLRARELAWS